MTPAGKRNLDYLGSGNAFRGQTDAQIRDLAALVDFWRGQAVENLKRALRAETMLAEHEGPIG